MSEFKIGQYKISTKNYYEALKKCGFNSDEQLKRLDMNGDKILTEDELTSVEINNDEETLTNAPQTQEEQIANIKEQYNKQLLGLYEQIDKLEETRRQYLAECGTMADAEGVSSNVDSAIELNSQIKNLKNQVINTLVNMENAITQIQASASIMQNGEYNINTSTSVNTGVNTDINNNMGSKPANFNYNFTDKLTPSQANSLNAFKTHWAKNKGRYQSIAQKTGVPAELIAAIHWRESSGNFNTRLHDGGSLKGFSSWEASAMDALKGGYGNIDRNNIQTWYDYAEHYNGMGYRNKGVASPYVWAGTSNYTSGKYVADGIYDAGCVDKQIGVAAMLKAIL